MSASADELMQDAADSRDGYDVDVVCSDCGDAAVVRFLSGEPVEESSLHCHCGGEMEAV